MAYLILFLTNFTKITLIFHIVKIQKSVAPLWKADKIPFFVACHVLVPPCVMDGNILSELTWLHQFEVYRSLMTAYLKI